MSSPTAGLPHVREPWTARIKRLLLGGRRELDPTVFHKVSLIALLAWVGLGADGLSSSAYGPEQAFKTLGPHTYLAVGLALATAFTVLVISYAYSRIIEQFPLDGGGYVVASRLLGQKAGVVSGSALVVDYVLTISISIAAAGDAIFSFLPPGWTSAVLLGVLPVKLLVELAAIGFLILLNLRGVKESVIALAPLFMIFLISHAILIGGVIIGRLGDIPAVFDEVHRGLAQGLQAPPVGLGLAGMMALFVRAYALGGGTYTGIEAVSNGLSIMREPKVQTGKRTMANMAVDSYMPHRFSQLSDRLTMSYGVLLIGGASLLALIYTGGNVTHLVVLYSINVFLTFSLSELAMCRFWLRERKKHPTWRKHISVHLVGLTLCAFILTVTVYEKFGEGGWVTLALTGGLIAGCFLIRRHYRKAHDKLRRLHGILTALPIDSVPTAELQALDPVAPTAVLLVGGYSGLGIHSLLAVQRLFPGYFRNFLFVSVGVIDSASFVNVEAVDEV